MADFIDCRDVKCASISAMAEYMAANSLHEADLYAVVHYRVDLQWREFDDDGNYIKHHDRFGRLLPIVVDEYRLVDDIEDSIPDFITADPEKAYDAFSGAVSERMENSGNWWQLGAAIISSHITWDEEEECFVVPWDDVCTTTVAPLKLEEEEEENAD